MSEQFPNSGTLDTQMREFLKVLENSKRKDSNIETLISLVTEIAYRNPRVSPTSIAILSLFLKQIENKEDKLAIIKRIRNKFFQIPNSSLLKVWLQRLYLKIDETVEYDEPLCKKVLEDKVTIWNTEWLNQDLKTIIDKTSILKETQVKNLKKHITKKEIKFIASVKPY